MFKQRKWRHVLRKKRSVRTYNNQTKYNNCFKHNIVQVQKTVKSTNSSTKQNVVLCKTTIVYLLKGYLSILSKIPSFKTMVLISQDLMYNIINPQHLIENNALHTCLFARRTMIYLFKQVPRNINDIVLDNKHIHYNTNGLL